MLDPMIEPVLDDARAARRGEPDQGEPGSGGRVVRRSSAGADAAGRTDWLWLMICIDGAIAWGARTS